MNGFQQFNRANFYFLKFEIFSKNCCLSIFELMNFLRLGIGLLDSSRDTEMVLKILISFLATFLYNIQLICVLSEIFLVIFELMDLQGPMNFFQVLQIYYCTNFRNKNWF